MKPRNGRTTWIAAAALLSACVTVPKTPAPPRTHGAPASVDCPRVYAYWPSETSSHTSLLIRKEDFPVPGVFRRKPGRGGGRGARGAPDDAAPPKTDWIEVGFGDAEYFDRGEVPKLSLLHDAPGLLVVRPFRLGGSPDDWKPLYDEFWPVELTPEGYRALLGYIADSFARGPGGGLVLDKREGDAGYYASTVPYNYRSFCHTWVLRGLKAAGLKTSPWTFDQAQVVDWFRVWYRPPRECRERPAAAREAPRRDSVLRSPS
jgi:hypothetical protein